VPWIQTIKPPQPPVVQPPPPPVEPVASATPSWALPAPPPSSVKGHTQVAVPTAPLIKSEPADEKKLLIETTLYEQQQQLEVALMQFDQRLVQQFGLNGIIPADLSEMRTNLQRRLNTLRDDYKKVWNERRNIRSGEVITLDDSPIKKRSRISSPDGLKSQLASQVIQRFYFLEKQRQFVDFLDELDREFDGSVKKIVLEHDEYDDEEESEVKVISKKAQLEVPFDDEEREEKLAALNRRSQEMFVNNYMGQMQQIVSSSNQRQDTRHYGQGQGQQGRDYRADNRPRQPYTPKSYDHGHGYRRGDDRYF
jgi:hypothetical protein